MPSKIDADAPGAVRVREWLGRRRFVLYASATRQVIRANGPRLPEDVSALLDPTPETSGGSAHASVERIMKLCLPTEGDEGLTARLSDHFGRAPTFTVVDPARPEVETFANPERRHDHGRCVVATYLADRGVDAVACREIGRNAFEALKALGIEVYLTACLTVDDVREEARASRLEPACGPTP